MKDEYGKLRAKRDTLVARAQAAKAQKEIHGIMGGFGKDNARRGFDRMEEKGLLRKQGKTGNKSSLKSRLPNF